MQDSSSHSGEQQPVFPRKPGAPFSGLRLQLLGAFNAWVGTRYIPAEAWRRRKARSLVALLGLSPGYQLPREQVQELLWPEQPPRAAANNLHQTLHAARRTLQPDLERGGLLSWLRLEHEVLRLGSPDALAVDVQAFEAAAQLAHSSRDVAAYEHALALYTGDLLPAENHEDWIVHRRESLRGRYIELCLALVRLQDSAQQTQAAIKTLELLLSYEPAHEAAHVALMRLHHLAGDRYRSLRQYQLLRDALWLAFEVEPDPASEQLYDAILSGQAAPAGSKGTTGRDASARLPTASSALPTLPDQQTRLIGREQETQELVAVLSTTRLLTLVGLGGIGKTRLARHVAELLAPEIADGVSIVDIALVSDPELVPHAVAATLSLGEEANRPLTETLATWLSGREFLLVLDNCEHLAVSCAALVRRLLETAPGVRVLATSRDPLHVTGEVLWPVLPLEVPNPDQAGNPEQLASNPSVTLFVERVRRVRPVFTLRKENAPAVVAILRRVEGLPLAIELAAARVGILTAAQVAERLDDALTLLRTSNPSVEPKHRSLRATLDWSYTLLDEPEQALFRRLAIFVGGAPLEAVEAVCTGEPVEVEQVLDVLERLVEHSLLLVEERSDEVRYRLLEPVRQYAALQLEHAGERERLGDDHLSWYLKLAAEAEIQMRGSDQVAWFNRLEVEHDNLRRALAWALERGEGETALQIGVRLMFFWSRSGYLHEGRIWIERALTAGGQSPSSLRAEALHAAGRLALSQVDLERTETFLEESLALARELDDKPCMARALNDLGNLWWHRADYQRAAAHYEEALTLSRDLHDTYGIAAALHNLGLASLYQGDLQQAGVRQEESLALLQALGNQEGIAVVLHALGQIALDEGRHEAAAALLQQSVELSHALGYRSYIAHGMVALAAVAVRLERWERAARLMGAAEALREEIGSPLPPNEQAWVEPYLGALRAHLPAERLARAWVAGRGLSLEGAMAESLEVAAEPQTVGEDVSLSGLGAVRPRLTRREREIATLLACGMRNREIAAELGIGARTVETHVNSLLHKLGLRSRREVAEWLLAQDPNDSPAL